LAPQLAAVLQRPQGQDDRSRLGAERGGRRKAAEIADRVVALATGAQHV
jgi:malonate decarboxylase gamma subunit